MKSQQFSILSMQNAEEDNMDEKDLIVDGFKLPSYKEAQLALKEKENIETIKARLDMSNGSAIYQIYEKLIQREMFKTIVGYSFLNELRHLLVTEFLYNEEDLPIVVLPERLEYDKVNELNKGVLETKIQDLLQVKKRMLIVIAALVFMVVAMFVIAAINPNVGYINTENKILNKYSAWQEDLEQREQVIKEKEAELGIDEVE